MSFNTALSGLNAAQADLSVTSNNIANVNTTGFKESRAEFGDIFASSAFGRNSKTAIGSGVLLSKVAQQFSQGNLQFTSNNLDLAIKGEGFFVVAPSLSNQDREYTRAGAFGVDANGFVVNGAGQFLQVFPVNQDGTVTTTSISGTVPLQLPATAGVPTPTSAVNLGIKLSANAPGLDPANFDPTDPDTYSAATSVTVYDSFGQSHISTFYYVKDSTGPANTWQSYMFIDGNQINLGNADQGATLSFNTVGQLVSTTPATIQTPAIDYGNGSDSTGTITVNYGTNTTQLSSTSNGSYITVNSLSQDGFATGELSSVEISDTGVVRANFSNGQTIALGKVALARFQNPQGLAQLGNATWSATLASGNPLPGEAGTSVFGLINSGALETSNVDLTSQLVNLITAQRNYQANARSIETSNTVTQTIINIR